MASDMFSKLSANTVAVLDQCKALGRLDRELRVSVIVADYAMPRAGELLRDAGLSVEGHAGDVYRGSITARMLTHLAERPEVKRIEVSHVVRPLMRPAVSAR